MANIDIKYLPMIPEKFAAVRFWKIFLPILKRWSRSGLIETCEKFLQLSTRQNCTILSVGGFGKIDVYLSNFIEHSGLNMYTLDIDESHKPMMVGSIEDCKSILNEKKIQVDTVIALEVFEHVENLQKAMDEIYSILPPGGILIASTPWIHPIHDRPNDFRRITPKEIQRYCERYSKVEICARGNQLDSLILLALRGLFAKEWSLKAIMIPVAFLSLFMPKPRIYFDLERIDSTIGYVWKVTK